MCQVGIVEDGAQPPTCGGRCGRVVSDLGDIRTGHLTSARDEPGGCPLIGQAVSGVEAT